MARSNSPGYPNMSLPKAISAARKMFDADRRNPIDRVTAAKHIGYSGQSGASDKALGSLSHYGLVEKTGKGELRISQLAVDIIHPDPTNHGSEGRALWQAGMNPQVFKDLRARFPEHVSEDSLRSYLVREGFNNVAISPVMNSFFETFRFLEQYKAFESGGKGVDEGEESAPLDNSREQEPMYTMTIERPATVPPPVVAPVAASEGESEWMRNLVGRDTKVRLLVTGDMGPKEIGRLIKLLEAQKAVLDDEDNE